MKSRDPLERLGLKKNAATVKALSDWALDHQSQVRMAAARLSDRRESAQRRLIRDYASLSHQETRKLQEEAEMPETNAEFLAGMLDEMGQKA